MTIRLAERVLCGARVLAARCGTSIASFLTGRIEAPARDDGEAYERARQQAVTCSIRAFVSVEQFVLAGTNGMSDSNSKEDELFELAERFRAANDPQEAMELGEQLGRLVFGE